MRLVSRILGVGINTLLFAGCVRQPSSSNGELNPVTALTKGVPDSAVASPLSALYAPGTVQYVYGATSIVQSVSGDSVPRIDSTRVTANLSATFQADPAGKLVRAITRADSIDITIVPNVAGTRARMAGNQVEQQDTLEFDRGTGRIRLDRPVGQVCGQETTAPFFRGDELMPALPHRMNPGVWTDTTVRQVCRAGVALQLTQIARYQLLPQIATDSVADYRIVRITESRIAGTGTQWQQPVEVLGRGAATDTFVVGRQDMRLRQAAMSARVEIEFRSERRQQRFIQSTEARITRRIP